MRRTLTREEADDVFPRCDPLAALTSRGVSFVFRRIQERTNQTRRLWCVEARREKMRALALVAAGLQLQLVAGFLPFPLPTTLLPRR